ncbi:MAG: bifunctional demethylmenaquinone methyltransferase/2-methoxy-6-polyprenyl-1,4-benzoquinol methylase UbiE [Gammaproteobacteria bacterium]|nr:bifunctional demethylmenaquinone methyltransferase/2-methoxy-6-polyprenyl-1,4-benzoquinol methylase UbiE [Gammaproteobacteria bacterium]
MSEQPRNDNDRRTADFGYEEVPYEQKQERVRGVFDSVASKYDLMNDLMSGGIHRVWKYFTLSRTALKPGMRALDVAGGTGDLSRGMSDQVGPEGQVILSDINGSMLDEGRRRLIDKGYIDNVRFVQANAEQLPFDDNEFDCVTIGFGLRNVTDKDAALREMHRVLRPGGRLLVLEFSKPTLPGLNAIYDAYSFRILPKLGQWVTGDADSYRYLAESIRKFPNQATLREMMLTAGFDEVSYHNLTGGIVALHIGFKF